MEKVKLSLTSILMIVCQSLASIYHRFHRKMVKWLYIYIINSFFRVSALNCARQIYKSKYNQLNVIQMPKGPFVKITDNSFPYMHIFYVH